MDSVNPQNDLDLEVPTTDSSDSDSIQSQEDGEAGMDDPPISPIDNDSGESAETGYDPFNPESHYFDLTLPTTHSYLGDDLEEVRGPALLDEGICVNLPLFIRRSFVLFPGQTLPLTVFSPNVMEMLDECISKNKTFGVVSKLDDQLQSIGTTAEIYEYTSGTLEGGYRVKAKGRQRFRIVDSRQEHGKIMASVKIVPEVVLPPFLYEQKLESLNHQRIHPQRIDNKRDLDRETKVQRIEAVLTAWPSWVHNIYDPNKLCRKIRNYLTFIENRGSYIPTDPTELSFWAAQNLPLNDKERITLLQYDNAIPRLQWILNFLTKERILLCSNCGRKIGKQSDIFPMSKEGPQSTFCNPGGFIYDTVTLYKTENIALENEPPSASYSWFPGYSWIIARCRNCEEHIGWKFVATDDKTLRPQAFWGLTRKNLISIEEGKYNEESNDT